MNNRLDTLMAKMQEAIDKGEATPLPEERLHLRAVLRLALDSAAKSWGLCCE